MKRRHSLLLGATTIAIAALAATAAHAGAPLADGPLHTDSRWIKGKDGKRVKLASVNWDGAESPEHVVAGLDRAKLRDIVRWIRTNGFNSVRLPWSNQMYESNPRVKDAYLKANPELEGERALTILDRVISELDRQGLMVVLDNHVSRSDWCCSLTDGNGLWYTDKYPEAKWISDWKGIVARYKNRSNVVAPSCATRFGTPTASGRPGAATRRRTGRGRPRRAATRCCRSTRTCWSSSAG